MRDTQLVEDLRRLAPFPVLSVLLTGVAAVVLGWLVWRLARHPPNSAAQPAPAPATAPWDTALAGLEALVHLLQPERSREYGIAATTLLRGYVEMRFDLHAPRQTTEEFLRDAVRSPRLPPTSAEALGRFLNAGDLFKFGRFQGSREELSGLHASAVAFVLATRPGKDAAAAPATGGRPA